MRHLLTLNTGSSSVKFRLFSLAAGYPLVAGGKVTGIGTAPVFNAKLEGQTDDSQAMPAIATQNDAVRLVLAWLEKNGKSADTMAGIAHRIVHGGERYKSAILLDAEAMSYLHTLDRLAPLHQPHNLKGVDLFAAEMPAVPQYGCFDTAFHAEHDELHSTFALPAGLREQGMRRYGFHGLSYDWIARHIRTGLPHLANGKVVAAHLGNGASLCALQSGRSIDTTMGMTALDGLPMGTRCGALDAGALIYMIRDLGLSADEAEYLLYEEAGLKGLSGISNDVQTLIGSAEPRAAFAIDYFCHKTAQYIAMMATSLGGLDALVFTGGIGENAAGIRGKILARLAFLPGFEHHVIPANEERSMLCLVMEKFAKELQV